ncbi:MAG: hypothetical protein HQM13_16210 [SAR324 cluster bacterium]|nr:hypothetical protein [SAR324 cluster bacterium]
MLEEYNSGLQKLRFTSAVHLTLNLARKLFIFALLCGAIGISAWTLQQILPLRIFEAGLLVIGTGVLFFLISIHEKIRSIEQTVAEEEWDEEVEFYSEEEQRILNPDPIDFQSHFRRGNVIHLKQKSFSENQEQ